MKENCLTKSSMKREQIKIWTSKRQTYARGEQVYRTLTRFTRNEIFFPVERQQKLNMYGIYVQKKKDRPSRRWKRVTAATQTFLYQLTIYSWYIYDDRLFPKAF